MSEDSLEFIERKNLMKKSKVVTFIGCFYIFGGIIVLLSLLFNGSPLNIVFDAPSIPDYIVKLLVGFIYIPMGYLYVKRVKFSNWITLILQFCSFALVLTYQQD